MIKFTDDQIQSLIPKIVKGKGKERIHPFYKKAREEVCSGLELYSLTIIKEIERIEKSELVVGKFSVRGRRGPHLGVSSKDFQNS